jgi:tRNA threonylcarbamoyl adenosine modification protein (Sua5/YciO/YrdC/YwlC family)
MARYYDVHPVDPQRRAISQVADVVRNGGLIAYPTDSCFALGCALGNREGLARIRAIRHLGERHHFTLVCHDFAQLGQFVHVSNAMFRLVRRVDAGQLHVHPSGDERGAPPADAPAKKTVGVRIPEHVVERALLAELEEPLLHTLLLPDHERAAHPGLGDQGGARQRRRRGDRLGGVAPSRPR